MYKVAFQAVSAPALLETPSAVALSKKSLQFLIGQLNGFPSPPALTRSPHYAGFNMSLKRGDCQTAPAGNQRRKNPTTALAARPQWNK